MSLVLFAVSVLIYVIPIIQVFRYNGESNFGICLNKKWLIGIAGAELILLILCWIVFVNEKSGYEDDFFYWYISIIYFRGTFPAIPILVKFDSVLSNFALGAVIYVTALTVDYLTLLSASFIRSKIFSIRNSLD
ncbi:MAG: hypothetical protein D6732_13770 [Methanobacteriota archaeon]|nr:MAG: hypothetical protein D6732_13770 [Euryarchaeota archaeon]